MSWPIRELHSYSAEDDELINRCRFEGLNWAQIAMALGRSARAGGNVRNHARSKCLAGYFYRPPPPPPPEGNPRLEAGSEPLPPMHPISWSAIQ